MSLKLTDWTYLTPLPASRTPAPEPLASNPADFSRVRLISSPELFPILDGFIAEIASDLRSRDECKDPAIDVPVLGNEFVLFSRGQPRRIRRRDNYHRCNIFFRGLTFRWCYAP